jgi:hypothetical protein
VTGRQIDERTYASRRRREGQKKTKKNCSKCDSGGGKGKHHHTLAQERKRIEKAVFPRTKQKPRCTLRKTRFVTLGKDFQNEMLVVKTEKTRKKEKGINPQDLTRLLHSFSDPATPDDQASAGAQKRRSGSPAREV